VNATFSAEQEATRLQLLRCVLDADKDDYTPRLVYADFLEEYGNQQDRDYAEFIRHAVLRADPKHFLSSAAHASLCRWWDRFPTAVDRSRFFLTDGCQWSVFLLYQHPGVRGYHSFYGRPAVGYVLAGFVDIVEVTVGQLKALWPQLLQMAAVQPIAMLELSDLPALKVPLTVPGCSGRTVPGEMLRQAVTVPDMGRPVLARWLAAELRQQEQQCRS
jgi:uncharacterized protein (TIGR02996 family)